jgi:hypothetical protein
MSLGRLALLLEELSALEMVPAAPASAATLSSLSLRFLAAIAAAPYSGLEYAGCTNGSSYGLVTCAPDYAWSTGAGDAASSDEGGSARVAFV